MDRPNTAEIRLSEHMPAKPQTVWKVLTTGPLIGRWLGMEPDGFAPVVGTRFTYQTDPAGAWDGTINCEVLEVIANERLVYSWKSGDAGNTGYGAPLDTLVTYHLEARAGGTLLRVNHAGFRLPQNETAHRSMSAGWQECAGNIQKMTGEE